MTLLDQAASLVGLSRPKPAPEAVPVDVKPRLDRGRKEMLKDASKRRLCMRFRKGDSYWYLDAKSVLTPQGTATNPDGTGKPRYRIRNRYDFLGPIIDGKVSSATTRIPGWEVSASTPDSERKGAAIMSQHVLRYGYDKWRYRHASIKAIDLAVGGGGRSYTMPYLDPNVGPYVPVPDGMGGMQMQGTGEIKLLVLTGNEVYSEPGVAFDESPWYAIERAWPKDEVRKLPGFILGSELPSNATTSDVPSDRASSENMTTVVEYFERPSPQYPKGRCMTFAAGKPIVDYRLVDPTCTDWWGCYPLEDANGNVLDEPILHELVYRHDPEDGSDLGLTWALIDFQRTAQDCWNKILEYKNRVLFPQMVAAQNTILTPRTDEPGALIQYKPLQGIDGPKWETTDSSWLAPLESILNQAIQQMRDVAAADDFQADPRVAAAAISAVQAQNTSKWESFLGDLAEWHSRVARHCLLLVAKHYTEPRLLEIRGRWGQPQVLRDFQGADLLGEVNVTVNPDSLAPRTRQQVRDELTWINANFPGYLSPEVTIAALHNGTAEDLVRSYELDMGRVSDVIRSIVDGTVMDLPDRATMVPGQPVIDPATGQPQIDPATGQPVPGPPQVLQVPSYMPSEVDSIPIWKRMFGDWMKTQEFLTLDPAGQEVANQIWSKITLLENQNAIRQQQLQTAMAQGLGMANAAAPQNKGMPSQPGDGTRPVPPGAPQTPA